MPTFGRRSIYGVAAALVLAVSALVASGTALGRSAADDLSLGIQLGGGGGTLPGTTTTTPFKLSFEVSLDSGPLQSFTLRVDLPDGLRWGSDGPDPGEGCTGTAPAVCVQPLLQNQVGTVGGGWVWDVEADRLGTFDVTASIQGELPDPDPSNNSATFRFEVVAAPAGGGGGGGGGSTSVSVGAVKLTPAKPTAGAVVIATALVRADGDPVKPTKVACAGTLAGKKVTGKGTAAMGKATCRYATPKNTKGNTLVGSMAITVKGKTITWRFSARLR